MSTTRNFKNKKLLLILSAVLTLLFVSGALFFLRAAYVPVIIMYHSVGEQAKILDGYGAKLNVSPAAFEKQMKFLRDRRYKVIPLTEFIEKVKSGKRIPYKTIAITFDDGLKNNFSHAYPALKKYNFPATIFVVTNLIGKRNFLTLSDIKVMQQNNISIGSHTISHGWLPSLGESELRNELFGSKKILEDLTGEKIETLSYPIGAFDERVREMAVSAGYIGAVATNPGRGYPNNDPYALKRIRISMSSDDLFAFWIETSGYYTFIKEIRDDD